MKRLKEVDPEIAEAIRKEARREQEKLVLIASENYASRAVLEATGSVMTNKYAEGYPGKRYYGGCEFVDRVEELAIERVRALFGAEHANVQPHSGSQANQAVYLAVLKPGDTILGMSLAHGGHLSHGSPVNLSGILYKVVPYGVDRETGLIDHENVAALTAQHRPKMIVVGASAYSRVLDFKRFREIADGVGALLMADVAHYAGLIVAGLYPNPFPYADFVTTTTHKTLRGPRGGVVLCKAAYAKAVDKAVFPGLQGGPLMHVIAAKAVAFQEARSDEFREYQQQVLGNARALAEALISRGYKIFSGGTDCHMMLVDLRPKGITGRDAEAWLDAAGITVNKNAIPYDEQPPAVAGGIRLGTPILATRGMGREEMGTVAELIDRVLTASDRGRTARAVSKEVRALCKRFPLNR